MSTHKTIIDSSIVLSFLQIEFADPIINFEIINGGESSQAYSFESKGEEYVIRVDKHSTMGFQKDAYAFDHFSSPSIPIPKVYKIGRIDTNYRFCISQKVEGKIINKLSDVERKFIIPDLFKILDSIHSVDINKTEGYGKWDREGKGKFDSWKDTLLSVDEFVKGSEGKPSLFDTSFLERDFWDKASDRFVELIMYCPEEKCLVHGDYGFNNALSDGKKVTGIIDWADSMYGDFIYDIAWLSIWSYDEDYANLYLEHRRAIGKEILNFHERLLCYELFIGLRSIGFFAYSKQEDKYRKLKEKLESLL